MRRFLSLLLTAALLLTAVACGGKTTGKEDDPAQTAQIPNPVVVVDSEDVISQQLGISLRAPDGAEGVIASVIDGSLGQIDFTFEGERFTWRAAFSEEDISGVFETFSETEQAVDIDAENYAVSVRCRFIEGGGVLYSFTNNGCQYTMYAPDAADLPQDMQGDSAAYRALTGAIENSLGEQEP